MRSLDTNVGFLIPKEKFPFYHEACACFFITSKYIKVEVGNTVLQTNEFSVVHGMLNEILQKLTPAGIPQYLLTHHESNLYGIHKKVEQRNPEILSIGDLKFVFVLWMSGCGIAAITLALEIFRVCQLRNVIKIISRCWKSLKMFLNKLY